MYRPTLGHMTLPSIHQELFVENLKSVKQNKKITKVNTAQENKVHVIVVVSAHRP